MSSPKVKVPGPSAAEQALQAEQTAILRQQRDIIQAQVEQQKALLPFFAEQSGLILQFDDEGNITGAEEKFDPLKEQRLEIEQSLLDRTQAALAGNLPVDPALEADLAKQETKLRDVLGKQFGAGFETATPAIQRLEEFRRTAEQLRSGARTGQLTLAEQLGIARENQRNLESQSQTQTFRQFGIGDPLAFAGGFQSNAAGFNPIMQRFADDRALKTQVAIHNSKSSAGMFGAAGQLFGTLFSAFI